MAVKMHLFELKTSNIIADTPGEKVNLRGGGGGIIKMHNIYPRKT